MKLVINKCFGGFGLSEAAYEKLIEWGVPVRKYVSEQRNPETGLYERPPENKGEIIFDRDQESEEPMRETMRKIAGRYWDTWISQNRTHPLLIKAVEELGDAASGRHAKLAVIEIPDGIEWEIDEYDGQESVSETHRVWS